MIQAAPRRFPAAVVVLGYVLWVPAAVILMLTAGGTVAGYWANTMNGPAIFAGLVIGLLALPFLAAGMFLSMRRKVWACGSCGYAFDRA